MTRQSAAHLWRCVGRDKNPELGVEDLDRSSSFTAGFGGACASLTLGLSFFICEVMISKPLSRLMFFDSGQSAIVSL